MLDLDHVRSAFPALEGPWALLDNAGGSAPARGVVERVAEHLRRRPVQANGRYPLAREAAAHVAAGRRAAADLVGAEPDEVVLGASTTACLALLALSLRPLWAEGDEVVVTDVDHEANAGPWRRLESTGVRVRTWRLRPGEDALSADDLEPLLGPRTRLVAFPHASNLLGTVHDVAGLTARVRAAGALSVVDGVAYAPHRRVDVAAFGADVYALSLYKTLGPHLGLLHVRRELLARLRSLNHAFLGEDLGPGKLEPGGPAPELVASIPGILEHHDALDRHHGGPDEATPAVRLARTSALMAAHEAALVAPLLEHLRGRDDVRLLGAPTADPARRLGIVSFTVDGVAPAEVATRLEDAQVAVRSGHFHAWHLAKALGVLDGGGAVRVSVAHYNTPAEIDRLLEALAAIRAA